MHGHAESEWGLGNVFVRFLTKLILFIAMFRIVMFPGGLQFEHIEIYFLIHCLTNNPSSIMVPALAKSLPSLLDYCRQRFSSLILPCPKSFFQTLYSSTRMRINRSFCSLFKKRRGYYADHVAGYLINQFIRLTF